MQASQHLRNAFANLKALIIAYPKCQLYYIIRDEIAISCPVDFKEIILLFFIQEALLLCRLLR